jgi:lipoate-protein ligase A
VTAAPEDPAAAPVPAPGALNMALDQALFAGVQAGGRPVLRLYRWQPACLSLGRNQRAVGVYDPELARRRGVDIVRRPTGGLAVLHDAELTYAVAAPAPPLGGPRAAYVRINQALVAALRALGAPAAVSERGASHTPSPDALHPCFERPAAGGVVAAGRKLVGSAQRVEQRVILQHGSILLSGSQATVLALQAPALPGGSGEITLAELLGSVPEWGQLLAAVTTAFQAEFGICLAPSALDAGERAAVAGELERFRSAAWTWRR